ncbi:MAG: SDR family oxidoreductase [Pseudomonadota bacterium]
MRLKDKVALITGGGSGIGEAIARLFAQEGASVAITGRRKEPLEKIAEEIIRAGGKALAISGSVTLEADVQNAVQSTQDHFGYINVLVNNAGNLSHPGPLHEITDPMWDEIMDVYLKGTFRFMRAAIPAMLNHGGGTIINISSIAGLKAFPWGRFHPYAAAKAGVIMLTKTAALEYAKYNIRCNCICPGIIYTPHVAKKISTPDEYAVFNSRQPLERMGKSEEIAQAALYFASDESAWTTGAVLTVDGGVMA